MFIIIIIIFICYFLFLYAYPRLLRPSLFVVVTSVVHCAHLFFFFHISFYNNFQLVDPELTDCTKGSGRGKVGGARKRKGRRESSTSLSFWNDQMRCNSHGALRVVLFWCGTVRPSSSRPLTLVPAGGGFFVYDSMQRFFSSFCTFLCHRRVWGGWHRDPGPV
jgi:hypothetical protein